MSTLLIEGEDGFIEDEVFTLKPGEKLLIGRSSRCDISIKDCPRLKELSQEERTEDSGFMSVSRQHAEIIFHEPERIEINDMSSNGTFLDDERIEDRVLDLTDDEYRIRLGVQETILLSLIQFQHDMGDGNEN